MTPADDPLDAMPGDPSDPSSGSSPEASRDSISDSIGEPQGAEPSEPIGDAAASDAESALSDPTDSSDPSDAVSAKPPRKRKTSKRPKAGKRRSRAKSSVSEAASGSDEASGDAEGAAFPFMSESTAAGADATEPMFDGGAFDHGDLVDQEVQEAAAAARAEVARTSVEPHAAGHPAAGATSADDGDSKLSLPARLALRLRGARGPDASGNGAGGDGASSGTGSLRKFVTRSIAVASIAIAAGFGYGAAVKLFFADNGSDLNGKVEDLARAPESAHNEDSGGETAKPDGNAAASHAASTDDSAEDSGASPTSSEHAPTVEDGKAHAADGSPHDPSVTQTAGDASHDVVADPQAAATDGAVTHESPDAASEPSIAAEAIHAEGADEVESAATGSGAHGATAPAPRLVGPPKPFEMPALSPSVSRADHPLTKGSERLDQGDIEAARRVAADYLLREDGLSAEDRLLIPQAYALLGDALRVELERSRVSGSKAQKDGSRVTPRNVAAPIGSEEGNR